jgi:hypothetical protein
MAGGVIYLDIDDEITSAAARVRAAEGRRVAVVLPHGSRVATSRINFRLLARDALTHEKRLSVIAADPATRALAASAGLPVFATVAEYEGSEEAPRPPAGAGAAAAVGPVPGTVDVPAADAEPGPATPSPRSGARPRKSTAAKAAAIAAGSTDAGSPPAQTTFQQTLDEAEAAELAAAAAALQAEARTRATPKSWAVSPDEPATSSGGGPPPVTRTVSAGSRGPGARTPLIVGAVVVALVVLVVGVAAYLFLPSATIVVTPMVEAVGPIPVTIVADPSASAPDPVAGVVPAELVDVDVTVTDTFPATGKRVEETAATGTVRFRNRDFTSSNTIPGGSIVSTPSGVRFKTAQTITIGRADIVGLTVFPKTASVRVTAVEKGTGGNVEPNTITVIPRGEDPIALDVLNPDATTGGTHEEFLKVTQKDIDAALAALQPALEAAFQAKLADPSIAPPGATVFPETGVLGPSTPTVDPATLLNTEVDTFDLGLMATGTATAVDEAPVEAVAEARLTATIDADHELVDGSIHVEVMPAVVQDGRVSFPATVSATQVAILDPDELKAMVLGQSVDEATATLEPYGTVTITTWPDWVSTIPTIESRVQLTIDQALPVVTPSRAPTPSRTPSPSPS